MLKILCFDRMLKGDYEKDEKKALKRMFVVIMTTIIAGMICW